jgi:hypothetical protein
MSRKIAWVVVMELGSDGKEDPQKVDELFELTVKDLVYDDEFIQALGETQSVSCRIDRLADQMVDSQTK